MSEANDFDAVVMRWRCGWCGAPTDEHGNPLAMSEIGLRKHIEREWKDAKLVNGECCRGSDINLGHAAIAEDLDA